MLVPIHTAGAKPPLFFIHGVAGITPLGSTLARALGPDQPLYVFHVNGIDGRQPVIDNMPELVRVYVEDIQAARPTGVVVIGGMCEGSLAVIEIAGALREQGRQVGPVILGDPQPVPPGYDRRSYVVDVKDPGVIRNLHRRASEAILEHASRPYNDMPFDAKDPRQLDLAATAAVASLIAFGRHVPRPYAGPAQLILSAERAPAFFHGETPWQDLLRGPRSTHVLPFDHYELFRSGREYFARALKFMLDEAGAFEVVTRPQAAFA